MGYSTYENRGIASGSLLLLVHVHLLSHFCLLANRTSPQSFAMYRWLFDAVVSLCIWRVLVHMHDEDSRCCDATRKHMQAHALLRLTENAGVDLWGGRLFSRIVGVLH